MTTYATRPNAPTFDEDPLIEALYRTEGKAEIVNGEIVEFMAAGYMPGYAADEIYADLRAYVRTAGLSGVAVADGKGFVVNLPNRTSFSPDASYYEGQRSGMRFFEGAPRFAVEVRSENDYGPVSEQEQADKRADYFAAGTLVVWDVDLLGEDVVRKYTSPSGPPQVFRREDVADAEPAVPGWAMSVNSPFEPRQGRQ